MPLTLRPYEKRDQDQVNEMILWSQNVEFNVPVTIADQPDLLDVAGVYQEGAGNFWVALDGEVVVGSIGLLAYAPGEAALRKMFVRAAYRGGEHGTAAALLATLLGWAREHEIRTISLGTVDVLRAAHRFYAKNGFVEIPKVSLPPSFPLVAVDTMFFRYDMPKLT